MKLTSIRTPLFSVVLAGSVVLGAAACTSTPQPAAPATSTDASVAEPAEETDAEDATPTSCETDADRGSSLDPDSVPAGLPDGFPGIGVPFYADAAQVAGHGDPGELFVLEYQSEHEPATVNEYYSTALVANCWEILDTSAEGGLTVHKAWLPGYSLVVAVGPDRIDDQKTSIHYTLRLQETP